MVYRYYKKKRGLLRKSITFTLPEELIEILERSIKRNYDSSSKDR